MPTFVGGWCSLSSPKQKATFSLSSGTYQAREEKTIGRIFGGYFVPRLGNAWAYGAPVQRASCRSRQYQDLRQPFATFIVLRHRDGILTIASLPFSWVSALIPILNPVLGRRAFLPSSPPPPADVDVDADEGALLPTLLLYK